MTGLGGTYPVLHLSNFAATMSPRARIFTARIPRGLKRRSELRSYRVRLGDRDRFVDCADREELLFVLGSLYVYRRLLSLEEAYRSVHRLRELYRYAQSSLLARYDAQDVQRHAIGGWPSMKDVTLHALVRRYRPTNIIETGVAQGISSTFLLDAIAQNGQGKLTSIDLPNFNPEGFLNPDGTRAPTYVKRDLGVGWLVPEELRSNWTLILRPAEQVLPAIDTPVDLFYHDSLHTYDHMRFEYDWAWGHLHRGGLLVSDDIRWNRAFPDFVRHHKDEVRVMQRVGLGVLARTA